MLFTKRFWSGIGDGSITVAFRRWKRPTVKVGGTLRSPGGLLAIDDVKPIELSAIREHDARAAGYDTRAELVAELERREGTLYRVDFHPAGPDPRDELRVTTALTDDEWSDLERRLTRLDGASRHGPWTATTLQLIAQRPATRAGDLAASVGRDTPSFKIDVRKLKALGLTESLEIGYRLSPRGEALLRRREP